MRKGGAFDMSFEGPAVFCLPMFAEIKDVKVLALNIM